MLRSAVTVHGRPPNRPVKTDSSLCVGAQRALPKRYRRNIQGKSMPQAAARDPRSCSYNHNVAGGALAAKHRKTVVVVIFEKKNQTAAVQLERCAGGVKFFAHFAAPRYGRPGRTWSARSSAAAQAAPLR